MSTAHKLIRIEEQIFAAGSGNPGNLDKWMASAEVVRSAVVVVSGHTGLAPSCLVASARGTRQGSDPPAIHPAAVSSLVSVVSC
jgi:hypothetical protein